MSRWFALVFALAACKADDPAPAPNGASLTKPPAAASSIVALDDALPSCCARTSCTALVVTPALAAQLEAMPDRPHVRLYLVRRTRNADLATLARVPWLRSLQIESSFVTDLSALRALTELEELYAGANGHAAEAPCKNASDMPGKLADVRPLAELESLRELALDRTQVEDISPLASLSKLEVLDLSHTKVTDIRPLAKLPRLSKVILIGLPIVDVTPLATLPELGSLFLASPELTSVSPLAGHPKLWYLAVSGARFDDLPTVATLPSLRALNVSGTAVRDLSPLARCTELESLDVSRTAVTSIAPLAALRKLSTLNLQDTQVKDLTPLFAMPALKSVRVPKGASAEGIGALRKGKPRLDVLMAE